MAAGAGTVWLAVGTSPQTLPTGSVTGNTAVVDLVGFGGTNTFETAPTAAPSATKSVSRTAGDTDNNGADFTSGAQNPQTCDCAVPPPTEFTGSIAEIQGTGPTSPHAGDIATTQGVVTAVYTTGGFNGFYLQTAGTGGATDVTPGASDALFVFGSAAAATVARGDFVQVKGVVSEFNGTTEISAANAAAVTQLADPHDPVTPHQTSLPGTESGREAHEGELLLPTGGFTVTDNYSLNQYGEIGLAAGDHTLVTPTEVADAGSAAAAAVAADNAARSVYLDDGASINFLSTANGGANMDIPLPYLTVDNPIRVGSAVDFTDPVILEYRNNQWNFQPTQQVRAGDPAPATFENTRGANEAPAAVPGDIRLATFNVLNYFNTTGADFVAAGGSCTFYDDRDGNHVTDRSCTPNGPRGAAEADDLSRQQTKIVTAINKLGAGIVSLEEIENSVALGEADRDDALASLVAALNAAAGSPVWAYVPSPSAADLPPTAEQDVIRTAFIYKPAQVELVGPSKVLVGSAAFADAREPLAQVFKPVGGEASSAFTVIVNHFKSKGSGVDDGTGQGNANPDRVAQAHALDAFADSFATSAGTDAVFLTGDFNSYSQEDPMQVLYDAGYTPIVSDTPGESTYNFDGMSGSLDHVLANDAALGFVTGADVWNINSVEAVAFEYSRFNYNATDFYQPNQFRASDHDPEIVGIDIPGYPDERAVSSLDVKATPQHVVVGRTRVKIHVDVSSGAGTPTGSVEVVAEGRTYTGMLRDGEVRITLAPFTQAGTATVQVRYLGDSEIKGSERSVTIEVLPR
jgi:predicted extracellular nuclease